MKKLKNPLTYYPYVFSPSKKKRKIEEIKEFLFFLAILLFCLGSAAWFFIGIIFLSYLIFS